MKLVVLSNLLTPHQLPFALELYSLLGDDFKFIETMKRGGKELPTGWTPKGDAYPFLYTLDFFEENRAHCMDLIAESDAVLFGSAPEQLLAERKKRKKLIFRYSERVYKKPCPRYQIPLRAIKYNWMYGRNKNLYLLCASAYTAGDYAKTRTFLNRAFKWGYFPATYEYDIDALMAKKESRTITWVARMIELKHPELAVEMARRLRADGIDFTLNMIGSGPLEDEVRERIAALGLGDSVKLLGSMKPEEVRAHMERSAVFLMTSDRQEGWGAVLNEAENSACAVLANSATGSAPYLIRDGENGYLYAETDIDDMYAKLKLLLLDEKKREEIGRAAYLNIHEHWNAENAAVRFLALAEHLLSGGDGLALFSDGICSPAEHYRDGWYTPKGGL